MQNSSLEVDKPEQKSEFGYKIQKTGEALPLRNWQKSWINLYLYKINEDKTTWASITANWIE